MFFMISQYPVEACKISSAHHAKRYASVYLGHSRAHDKLKQNDEAKSRNRQGSC